MLPSSLRIAFWQVCVLVVVGLANGLGPLWLIGGANRLPLTVLIQLAVLVLAILMRAGRTWAWITLAVLNVLNLVPFLRTLPDSLVFVVLSQPAPLVLGSALLQVLLCIVASVYMFTGASRRYFRRPKNAA